MTTLPFSRKALPIAILTALLAACGGGGGDSGASNTTPAVTEGTITGTAVKGLLQQALVTAYKITSDGKKGEKLTETTTTDNGEYTLKVTGYSGAVLLEMASNPNTKMLCDIPAGCDGTPFNGAVPISGLTLQTVLPELKASNKTAITPFTHLAAQYAAKNGLNKSNIEAALTQIADLFGLPALNETNAINPSGDLSSATQAEQQYAVMNAAIAQLAGKVADIAAKLNALSIEINSKNGQLQSSEVSGKNDRLDLGDVLAAAKAVATSSSIHGLKAEIKTIVDLQLANANNTQADTQVTPSTGAGLNDLGKAKAFINSASLLLTTLQQYDDQSFLDSLNGKVTTIQALDGDTLMADALGATFAILATAVEADQTSHVLSPTQINTLLADNFNSPYQLVATASNDLKLTVDATSNSATLNGELKLQRKRYKYISVPYTETRYQKVPYYVNNVLMGYKQEPYTYSGYNYQLTEENIGSPVGFTISNFKISYPAKTASSKDFTVAIDAGSKIKTANVEFSLAADSKSQVIVRFDNAATLQSHIDAADADTELATTHIPSRVEAKLDRITLKVIKAGNSEFSQFVGNMSLTAKQANLDTTTGDKRLWPMPELATLSGSFSSGAGDLIEATASIDLTGANPKVSPETGYIKSNLYAYSYNATLNTITLKPSVGTFGWSKATQLTITMVDCGNGQKRLSGNNDAIYLGSNCSSTTNVADAYKDFINNQYWYRWSLSTMVDGEGDYIPEYSTNFNYKSNATVNGILDWSDDNFSEDSAHLGKGQDRKSTR